MNVDKPWLLPDGIDEFLPPQAIRLEHMRRHLLKLFHSWGYELVIPPMVEFLDSLVVGKAGDLESNTFKLTDSASGKLIGVRADITPQVSRIDAHRLKSEGTSRLCYFGHVLLTRPRELGGSRNPVQCGAELYGYEGIAADLEIINMMMEALRAAKRDNCYIDLGHVGIFRSLTRQADLSAVTEAHLFDALQRKAQPEIDEILKSVANQSATKMLASLTRLNGGVEVLDEAADVLSHADEAVKKALGDLQEIAQGFKKRWPDKYLNIDLAELRGYAYHTGIVFGAYAPGYGQAIAVGGRYDGIGEVFGRHRPATGFSLDLTAIMGLDENIADKRSGVFAPSSDDARLAKKVAELRAQGERVIQALPGEEDASVVYCDRVLVNEDNNWMIKNLRK
ncbi:MAG: ATP phosphoribosyltransferase regulatory subunit [Gammaproteobacteria bacterium]|nr:ATP phosphoribosyltransferase regulatory subunit [Gammaproteobacteria bacterium]